MLVYNYDSVLKFYVSTSEADESPLEPGVWLIPAHATTVEPPFCTEDQIVIFQEDRQEWDIVDKVVEEYKEETEAAKPEVTEEYKELIKKKVEEKINLLIKTGLTREEAESFMLT
jgi:hypothetical protein